MTFQQPSLRYRGAAIAVAAVAILAAAPRETAPGRHLEPLPISIPLEDVAIFEEIQAWLEPSAEVATGYPGSDPLYESIQLRRESFELFIALPTRTLFEAGCSTFRTAA